MAPGAGRRAADTGQLLLFGTGQAGRCQQCVYLAVMALDPTGNGRRRWTIRWKPALNAFDLAFEGRLTAGRN
jgi:hypothetical protein